MRLYEIVRFYAPHRKQESVVIKRDLTLKEAKEHCNDKSTHQKGEWFDGYREQ
jgi:hypothetical protein